MSSFRREVHIVVRLRSLYKFYQAHFGYHQAATARQRLAFARAVSDCMDVLKEVYRTGGTSPISEYRENQYARGLTLRFLSNIEHLAVRRFTDPVGSLQYLDYEIEVAPQLLELGRKRKLIVANPLLWYPEQAELIFLTFGPANNMQNELGVFRTLSEQLSTRHLSVPVTWYTYWDLLDGTETTLSRNAVRPAPLNGVVFTCNQILQGR